MQPLRWIPHFLQVTVNPVAEPEALLERLEMDVAGPQTVGFQNQAVYHPDNGSVPFLGFSSSFSLDVPASFHLQLGSPHVGHERLQGLVGLAEILDDRFVDLFQWNHHGFQIRLQEVAQRIQGLEVEGVRNRHPQSCGQAFHRQGVIPPAFRRRNCGQHTLVHLLDGRDKFHAAVLGHELQNLIPRHQSLFHDAFQDGMTVHRRFLMAGRHVLRGNHP